MTSHLLLAKLHRNYFCQLIIHTHTNSRQTKLYILSYSVRCNCITVSDRKSLFVMILVKITKPFLLMSTWSLRSRKISAYVFYFSSVFLSSNQKSLIFSSTAIILVIWSVKDHFTVVMTTHLKKYFLFSEDTSCYLWHKSFQTMWK